MQKINEQVLNLIYGGCYCYCYRSPIVVGYIKYLFEFDSPKRCEKECMAWGSEYRGCYHTPQYFEYSGWDTHSLIHKLSYSNSVPVHKIELFGGIF